MNELGRHAEKVFAVERVPFQLAEPMVDSQVISKARIYCTRADVFPLDYWSKTVLSSHKLAFKSSMLLW